MSVNNEISTSGPYAGNDVTVAFSITFTILQRSQVVVYKSDVDGVITTLVQDVDYSVTGFPSAGTVVMTVPPATGEEIFFVSNYEETQLTEFESQGGFFPDVHEKAFDKLTYLILQANRNTLQLPISFSRTSNSLPTPKTGYGVKWDADGNLVEENLYNNLKKDGSDGGMTGELQMNNNRITGLPAPASPDEPVRSQDINVLVTGEGLIVTSNIQNFTLASGQTVVTLTELTTTQTAFFISGVSVDQGRLVPTIDYTVDSETQITLTDSYPEGALLTAVQNEGAEKVISDVQVFDNVASMKAATLNVGDVAMCKRYYAAGDLVDGLEFNVVATATVDGFVDHANANGTFSVLIRNGKIDLELAGGRENTDCKDSFDAALIDTSITHIKVPDGAILGQHIVTAPFVKIIEGGSNVVFDPAVNGAGLLAFEGEHIEIFGFVDAVLATFPLSGGVFADGHFFASLASSANIGTLIIRDNSVSGGRVGIAASFENSRTLRKRCEIYRNTFINQNGGEAGTGYGIQYANENDTGEAYIARNTVEEAGRHSFYLARNKGGGQISFEYNKAINHRENAPTQGSEVRSAIQVTRCSNVKGIGNEVDGFYDSALFIAEEGEGGGELGAEDITLYATTIKTPKNSTAAIYSGFITPSIASFTENITLNGITFESDASKGGVFAPVFNYAWGKNISLLNVNVEYSGITSGGRMFVLVGNDTTNSQNVKLSDVKIALKGCTGTYSIMRPVVPLATSNIAVEINNVLVTESVGATVNDYDPSATITNSLISVLGFSYPAASTSFPRPKEFPSLGIEGEIVHDFPSIAVGAQAGVNVTATGALVGDFAMASFSANLSGLTIHAAVIGSNTVGVFLVNNTGAPVDLPSGTVKVRVIQNHA